MVLHSVGEHWSVGLDRPGIGRLLFPPVCWDETLVLSCPPTGTALLVLSPSDLGWNEITCFLGSPGHRQQTVGLLILHHCEAISYNKSVYWFCFSRELWLIHNISNSWITNKPYINWNAQLTKTLLFPDSWENPYLIALISLRYSGREAINSQEPDIHWTPVGAGCLPVAARWSRWS